MSDRFRIAVAGGSVAGCAVAVELSRAGHEVTVFERSATALASQGAGIIAPAEVFQGMVARRLLPEDYARCPVTVARYACRDQDQRAGRWLGDAGFSLTTVGWADLFQHLRGQVPSGAYRNGVTVHGLADDDDAGCVTLKTSDGMSGPFDLIAFADGYRSLGRRIVAPGAELRYRGLVFWRGLISEADADIDRLDGTVTRVIYPGGHGAAYLIPPAREAAASHARTAMWGYYLPVTADDLGPVLTDAQGLRHAGSVPSGHVRADVSEAFTERLAGLIPPYFLDLIERTARTSIQAIYSARAPAYARGRLALIGDAGTVFPPYSGSGVLKAIANATSLPGSLAAAATAEEGLSAWSRQQEKTIQAIEPVAERNEKNLISEIPDLASLSPENSYSWLSAIHPGAHITLPRTG
jgi:2-polyprenyl-6-methoxyphenol hydroxylase-like FAD-dependent oxidoreductase